VLVKSVLLKKVLASGHLIAQAPGGAGKNAITHALSQPGVASAIVGTLNAGHLVENVGDVTGI
jgi:aryl-alcohol dehydrogenase-like predicted oxidoreductase